jgi:hypothetical protein
MAYKNMRLNRCRRDLEASPNRNWQLLGLLLMVHLGSLTEPMGTDGLASQVLLLLFNPVFSQLTCLACCLLHSGFLLALLINPEHEDDRFLWNFG